MSDDIFKQQRKALRRAQKLERRRFRKRSGGVLAGLLLLAVGVILLLRESSYVHIPDWLFTWPMILVAFGLFAGAGNSFRDPGWIIITGVGILFLLQKISDKIQ